MSTRSTIHFHYSESAKASSIIYRHSDGYPEAMGPDLNRFLDELQASIPDNRFTDPCYLAAKYVVWQAKEYAQNYDFSKNPVEKVPSHYLDFLSVGIMLVDPDDIEYRWHIYCDSKRPIVKYDDLHDKQSNILYTLDPTPTS